MAKMYQNGQKCLEMAKMIYNDPKCTEMVKNGRKCPKIAQKWLKYVYSLT